jgi:hypothetical protein
VSTSASLGMPVRDLRTIAARCAERDEDTLQLLWEGLPLQPDMALGEFLPWPLAPRPILFQVHTISGPVLTTDPRMSFSGHGPRHLPVQSQPPHAMERLGDLHPGEPRSTPFASGPEVLTPPGSSIVSVEPDYGPFSVTLVMEDGNILVQPTWPTINVQLLRRQVATSLTCSPTALYFVCHGSILGLERRLSDHPVITSTTRILLFFSLSRALESLGIGHDTPAPPTPPPPAPPTPRAPRPFFGPEPPPGFSRPHASPTPSPSTSRGGSNDKLRSTFK